VCTNCKTLLLFMSSINTVFVLFLLLVFSVDNLHYTSLSKTIVNVVDICPRCSNVMSDCHENNRF
jgi:p-aminobenzoyl-glutamate transporter AbgT